ncbi:hypothetical protein PMZ80_007039 [Knufia obscura]|uniref:Proline dehydrogenase n=1 Tax=Knufia obscura TaxID=1635080 RepID=A0ABR0RJ28_9EURO|nr:hypothetical protein PMZ80_007039 [Knufia obscura]
MADVPTAIASEKLVASFPGQVQMRAPLAQASTTTLVRSLLLGKCFASPTLFPMCMKLMKVIINSNSALLSPDRNIFLRALVRGLIYNHFCAGVTPQEVKEKVASIKAQGYAGVILGFSREIVVDDHEDGLMSEDTQRNSNDKCIGEWLHANLDTLKLIGTGDYMNIKFTGAGQSTSEALLAKKSPSRQMQEALDTIVRQARSQGTCIWVDAEQQAFQPMVDKWAIDLMRKHNRDGQAWVYNTIQAYLKASRQVVLEHMRLAKDEGWTLGIKLVRGAYLTSDMRERIWATKPETDENYNSIVRDVLSKSFPPFDKTSFPGVNLFVAGHNKESIRMATKLVRDLVASGEDLKPVGYGQLQGMADEVSCELVQLRKAANDSTGLSEEEARLRRQMAPQPYKCLAWGSVSDCMHFLTRRAVENATAMDRLQDGLVEVRAELKRRFLPFRS